MNSLVYTQQTLPTSLAKAMFRDRRRQFVDRQGWDLSLTEGEYEIDEYDDSSSRYLIVHQQYRHFGSCRVRPTTSPTMLIDHFFRSFPDAKDFLHMQRGRVYELTRFCRSPDVPTAQSKTVLRNLLLVLEHFRRERQLTGFVAVVYPKVARFMSAIGMRYIVLSRSEVNGEEVYMICITEATRVDSASIDQFPGLTEDLQNHVAAA